MLDDILLEGNAVKPFYRNFSPRSLDPALAGDAAFTALSRDSTADGSFAGDVQ